MINTGSGVTHTNGLMAAMNVPPMAHTTLHKREREMGNHIIQIAKNSCASALQEEKRVLREMKKISETEAVGLSVSFDGGWSTRGSGRSYNSDTGHAAMIGESTDKCLDFAVKSRRCRFCEVADRAKQPPNPHKCYQN